MLLESSKNHIFYINSEPLIWLSETRFMEGKKGQRSFDLWGRGKHELPTITRKRRVFLQVPKTDNKIVRTASQSADQVGRRSVAICESRRDKKRDK